MKTKSGKKVVNVITLGCSKNVVDSEVLLKQLDSNGLKVLHDSNDPQVDVVVINTCGFIKDAKEESVDTILQYVQAKERGDIQNLYVMGCLSERYKPDLEKEIPEVDKYFGTNNIKDIIKTIGYNYKDNLVGERFITTPSHYAYLKISEGCDRQCSFCAIPLMRGKHKSKSIESIVKEAESLAKKGVKELILIAQDLTYYGIDSNKKQNLAILLEQLQAIKGIEWIRLHYAYPAGFPNDVLDVMRKHSSICNYLDIPFQHISDNVLKKMRRGVTSQQTYSLIEKFRNEIPNLTLRTTLMVGHPGEGEEEFNELLEFVKQVRFDRLGVFSYSEEEDTYGARNFKDAVPEEIKQERVDKIMELQQSISLELNTNKLGGKLKVVVDSREGEYYIGRTEADSPEVDNEVLLKSDRELNIGEFYEATIIEANDYDLIGKVI